MSENENSQEKMNFGCFSKSEEVKRRWRCYGKSSEPTTTNKNCWHPQNGVSGCSFEELQHNGLNDNNLAAKVGDGWLGLLFNEK